MALETVYLTLVSQFYIAGAGVAWLGLGSSRSPLPKPNQATPALARITPLSES